MRSEVRFFLIFLNYDDNNNKKNLKLSRTFKAKSCAIFPTTTKKSLHTHSSLLPFRVGVLYYLYIYNWNQKQKLFCQKNDLHLILEEKKKKIKVIAIFLLKVKLRMSNVGWRIKRDVKFHSVFLAFREFFFFFINYTSSQ